MADKKEKQKPVSFERLLRFMAGFQPHLREVCVAYEHDDLPEIDRMILRQSILN